jgi:hypothetical protein
MANAQEVNWLTGALKDYISKNAENGYWSLPQSIKNYYAKQGNTGQTADQQSQINAATRGARYAQEGRINAIRSANGENPFDPMAAPPPGPQSTDPTYQAPAPTYTPPISQGTPPTPHMMLSVHSGTPYYGLSSGRTGAVPDWYETSPAFPGWSFAPGTAPTGPNAVSQANTNAFGGDVTALGGQMEGLQSYLGKRYTGAAQAAGTLGNTVESKQSIGADVNAGMPGAQLALQGQFDTSKAGAAGSPPPPTPSSLPAQTPTPDTVGPQTSNAQMPNTAAPSGAQGLVSGQSLSPQARMKALTNKQGLATKGINGP